MFFFVLVENMEVQWDVSEDHDQSSFLGLGFSVFSCYIYFISVNCSLFLSIYEGSYYVTQRERNWFVEGNDGLEFLVTPFFPTGYFYLVLVIVGSFYLSSLCFQIWFHKSIYPTDIQMKSWS